MVNFCNLNLTEKKETAGEYRDKTLDVSQWSRSFLKKIKITIRAQKF